MAQPAPYLVEEILEEIFVRLPTPEALARTACASPSFRRIVDAADFRYSFLPRPNADGASFTQWSPCDVRDGRVLLESIPCFRRTCASIHLAVCDPLSRRYELLPQMPMDLHQQSIQEENLHDFQLRLAPIGEDEDGTSFRVICWVNYDSKMVTIVFSSATGKWCIAASPSWSSLGIVDQSWNGIMNRFRYTRGCFYWAARLNDDVLVLDTRTMEFSTVNILASDHMQLMNLPQQSECTSSIIVPTEGAIEMFTVVSSPNGSFDLYHTTQHNNDGSCHLKMVMPLPCGFSYSNVGATEGSVSLRGIQNQPRSRILNLRTFFCLDQLEDLFSLEVKTSQLKKVSGSARFTQCVHSYFGFPTSLSEPSL